jgi:hypothetical protein
VARWGPGAGAMIGSAIWTVRRRNCAAQLPSNISVTNNGEYLS